MKTIHDKGEWTSNHKETIPTQQDPIATAILRESIGNEFRTQSKTKFPCPSDNPATNRQVSKHRPWGWRKSGK